MNLGASLKSGDASVTPTYSNCSWAIFHVVGANPAMKSESLMILPPLLLELAYCSDVSVIPDHDLPSQVRFLLLHWCNNPGMLPNSHTVALHLTFCS